MIEQKMEIPAPAGRIDTFICHPERRGPWPAVIFYMDAPGIREELYDMVRRLAAVGYYVILPNLYYRHGIGTVLSPDATDENSPEHARMFTLMRTLSNDSVADDTATLLDFVAREPAASAERVAALGYCMSGPFVVTAAARFPDRIAAAASFHGVMMATDKPDSPHLLGDKIRGEVYCAFGAKDILTPPAGIEKLRQSWARSGLKFEIEIYPDAGHGFVFPQRKNYLKAAAERHWERMFEFFARTLRVDQSAH